ncbi:hypothetical protein PTKIN_Ptkin05aG0060600 [Pterospermum kingtungense]
MEVAAAAVGWKLDTTIIFLENQLLQRLFTPSLAQRYEELYKQNGVKFSKVAAAKLGDGSTIEADTVTILL